MIYQFATQSPNDYGYFFKDGGYYTITAVGPTFDRTQELTAAIDGRIQGTGLVKEIYSVQDHANGVYQRNPKCWASTIDLSCASPWNSAGGPREAGTLISPQHVVLAAHYYYGVGTKVRFVSMKNEVVERTVTAVGTVPNTDICIAALDAPVPSTINFAKILPADWKSYIHNNYLLPLLTIDQEEKALIEQAMYFDAAQAVWNATTAGTPRAAFYETAIDGDSGNPVFMVYKNWPILFSHITSNNSGPSYAYFISQMNDLMASLGPKYKLWEFNLKGITEPGTVKFEATYSTPK